MSEPSLASLNPSAPEACPPPLAWQEVLQGVEQQGERFAHSAHGVDVEGVAIGDGPPLWFLNGFAGDRRVYSLLAWLLRDRFRCVLVDAAWPETTRPKLLQPLLAQAYVDAFQALGTPRPALFGSAFGAQTALTILSHSPGTVRGAVLHEGFFRRRPSVMEKLLAWGASRSGKQLAEIPNWPQIQEANHRRWFPPIDPSRWEFLLQNLGETSARRWAAMARSAAATTGLIDKACEITVPVQLIRTEGDGPVATAAMNELVVHLPDMREETLHTSGHFAFLTHPHRVAKIVAAFLGSL